jgi:hypothetical protein
VDWGEGGDESGEDDDGGEDDGSNIREDEDDRFGELDNDEDAGEIVAELEVEEEGEEESFLRSVQNSNEICESCKSSLSNVDE